MRILIAILVALASTFAAKAADPAYPPAPQQRLNPFVVKKPEGRGDPRSIAPTVLAGPITNSVTGHHYYLLSANDWTNSEAKAVSLGGHLVTINDEAEHEWISATFGLSNNTSRALWIGLNARFKTNIFEWSSGEAVSYTNWRPDAPNNDRPGKFFALIQPRGFSNAGLWTDSPGTVWGMWSQATGFVDILGVVEVAPRAQSENKVIR